MYIHYGNHLKLFHFGVILKVRIPKVLWQKYAPGLRLLCPSGKLSGVGKGLTQAMFILSKFFVYLLMLASKKLTWNLKNPRTMDIAIF